MELIINSDHTLEQAKVALEKAYNQDRYLVLKVKSGKTRTSQQNRALHLYFTLLAEALNDAGVEMSSIIGIEVDVPWNALLIKEVLWKHFQRLTLESSKTSKLKRKEVDEVYDLVNRFVSEFGIYIPLPRREDDD